MPEYRQVLVNLIARDLKVKYQSKSLGFAWSLLAPACMLAILYTIFSRAFRINMPDYWAFLIVGILPFQFMADAIAGGAGAIRSSAGLIRKVYLPMEILVIAAVTVRAIEFLLQMLLAVALLAVLHHPRFAGVFADGPPASVAPYLDGPVHFDALRTALVLPGAIALSYLFVLGVALPLAAWSVIYKDLDHIISIAMRVLFYGTPVFWAMFLFEGSPWMRLMVLNPFAGLIALYRGPLYWGSWPFNESVGGGASGAWGVAIAFALGAFVLGYALFDRSKRILAEVV